MFLRLHRRTPRKHGVSRALAAPSDALTSVECPLGGRSDALASHPEYARALKSGDVFRLNGHDDAHLCMNTAVTDARTIALSVDGGTVLHVGRHQMVLIQD